MPCPNLLFRASLCYDIFFQLAELRLSMRISSFKLCRPVPLHHLGSATGDRWDAIFTEVPVVSGCLLTYTGYCVVSIAQRAFRYSQLRGPDALVSMRCQIAILTVWGIQSIYGERKIKGYNER